MSSTNRRGARAGFTLIEVAVATIIVAMGLTAMLVSLGSSTTVNAAARKITQAAFLAEEIREWTLALPFRDPDPGDHDNPPGPDGTNPQTFVDDLDDLMNVTYSPPRDGSGVALSGMTGWSQAISISWRDPNDLTTVVANGASSVVRVQVDVACRGQEILSAGWFVTGPDE